MTPYHCRIAIGHFTRVLAADQESGRASPLAVALLACMWHCADPWAAEPLVDLPLEDLAAVCPSEPRLRRHLSRLSKVGAVVSTRRGWLLVKPPIDKLDEQARAMLATLPVLVEDRESREVREARNIAVQEAKATRKREQRERQQRRTETLERIGRQPAHFRNALAKIGKVAAKTMRYAGNGSAPTQAAIDWCTETGATWEEFQRVCLAAYHDGALPNKPAKLCELFMSRHRSYLDAIAEQALSTAATRNPLPSTGEGAT